MRNHKEEDLKKMIRLMQEKELEQLPDQETLQKTYELSDAFYDRMSRLQKRMARKEKFRKQCSVAAAAAAAFILVLFASHPQAVAEAGRSIMSWEKDFAAFHFKEESDLTVIPRYTLGYVPDGYELKMDEYYENMGVIFYSDGGVNEWHFAYSVSDADIWADNKDLSFSILKWNGKQIYYLEAINDTEASHMEWLSDDGNIAFSIHGCLSKEEMLKIIEGIKELN